MKTKIPKTSKGSPNSNPEYARQYGLARIKQVMIYMVFIGIGISIGREWKVDTNPSVPLISVLPSRKAISTTDAAVPHGGAVVTPIRKDGQVRTEELARRLLAQYRLLEMDPTGFSASERGEAFRILESMDETTIIEMLGYVCGKSAGGLNSSPVMMRAAFQRLAEINPIKALDYLTQSIHLIPDPECCLKGVFETWGRKDLNSALSAIQSLPVEQRDQARKISYSAAGAVDPRGTIDTLLQMGDYEVANSILSRWAISDPQAAAERAADLNANGLAMDSVAEELARVSPQLALLWAAKLPVEGKTKAEAKALLVMNANNPAEAAAKATELIRAGNTELPLHSLADSWARQSQPAPVAAWLGSLPDCPAKSEASLALGNLWLERDAMAASGWIASLPYGDPKKELTELLVRNTSDKDPDSALAWANSIDNPEARVSSLGSLFSTWLRISPDQAYARLNEMSSEERAMVLATMKYQSAGAAPEEP